MEKIVLVMDGDKDRQGKIRSVIEQHNGYLMAGTRNCADAVRRLSSFPVDLMLIDVDMRKLEGMVLLSIVKGKDLHGRALSDGVYENVADNYFDGDRMAYQAFLDRYRDAPVVMMAENPGNAGRTAGKIGAVQYLQKRPRGSASYPVSEHRLWQTLNTYIK